LTATIHTHKQADKTVYAKKNAKILIVLLSSFPSFSQWQEEYLATKSLC